MISTLGKALNVVQCITNYCIIKVMIIPREKILSERPWPCFKPASHCPTDRRIRGSDEKSDENQTVGELASGGMIIRGNRR